MSWIDLIKNNLTITMGDGKTSFSPSWLNATKLQEYNIAEFEFPNVEGTLVKRGTPLGRKFALELYFQGDNHLDQSSAFEFAAKDKRPWTLSHPFYGVLKVQPVSLLFDNSDYNVSKITGLVIETIIDGNPITSFSPVDEIAIQKNTLDDTFSNALTVKPSSKDISSMTASTRVNFNVAVPIIKVPSEFEEYNQAFNSALSAINNATSFPLSAMTLTIAFLSKPALFTAAVKTRIDALTIQFNNLRQNISTLVHPSSKQIYQNSAGTVISTMCLAASRVQEGDNKNAVDVLNTIDSITAAYNQYLTDLDSLQSTNGGSPDNFIPDASSLIGLNDLVNLTISSLFSISLNSKQERIFYTPEDTNLIVLTHQLYGLDVNDANIDELVAQNNFSMNDMLQIRKGTKILYYI